MYNKNTCFHVRDLKHSSIAQYEQKANSSLSMLDILYTYLKNYSKYKMTGNSHQRYKINNFLNV